MPANNQSPEMPAIIMACMRLCLDPNQRDPDRVKLLAEQLIQAVIAARMPGMRAVVAAVGKYRDEVLKLIEAEAAVTATQHAARDAIRTELMMAFATAYAQP